MKEMRIVKNSQKQAKPQMQIARELKEAIRLQVNLRKALIESSDIKVGDDVTFLDFDENEQRGRVTNISVKYYFIGKVHFSYDVLLYKKNGELGFRKSHFTVDIE